MARRRRNSKRGIMRRMPVRDGAVLSSCAFIGVPPVGCGVGHPITY
jgi:hypothetical protein